MSAENLHRTPAPDPLAFAIAQHLREATPGVRVNPHAPAWLEVHRWRLARIYLAAAHRMTWRARSGSFV